MFEVYFDMYIEVILQLRGLVGLTSADTAPLARSDPRSRTRARFCPLVSFVDQITLTRRTVFPLFTSSPFTATYTYTLDSPPPPPPPSPSSLGARTAFRARKRHFLRLF